LLFHKKLGTYWDKTARIEALAEWIARAVFGATEAQARQAAQAARLSKADLTTDMVREFTELQGTMGGIYAREEGLPEEVWRAVYFHYYPQAIESDAPPSRAQLGKAAMTWAPVSLADKLDTLIGLFAAGEKPTGSRDPYGLRRAAQGVIKLLVDGADRPEPADGSMGLQEMIERAFSAFTSLPKVAEGWERALADFLAEREMHLFERRGFRSDEVRAVVPVWWRRPQNALRRIEALAQARRAKEFETLALLFKRVKNITKDFDRPLTDEMRAILVEPAERELLKAVESRWPKIDSALQREEYREAMKELGALSGPVDRFFVDVLVMAEDRSMREARLALLTALRRTIMNIADIAEIAPEQA